MPKNKGKGGKNRRRGKNENEFEKRELIFKEDQQEYAQVTKMLGNGRLEAMCFDGVKRLCHIRGKLRKKVWINQGDIILVGLRDYQDSKADVILKYTPDEARNLKTYGEFPESVRINDTVTFVEDGFDEDIEFGDEISSEDDADSVDNIWLTRNNTKREGTTAGATATNEEELNKLKIWKEEDKKEEFDNNIKNKHNNNTKTKAS